MHRMLGAHNGVFCARLTAVQEVQVVGVGGEWGVQGGVGHRVGGGGKGCTHRQGAAEEPLWDQGMPDGLCRLHGWL